jgi:hypothetical protein
MKFKIRVEQVVVWAIEVDADSKAQAKSKAISLAASTPSTLTNDLTVVEITEVTE